MGSHAGASTFGHNGILTVTKEKPLREGFLNILEYRVLTLPAVEELVL